MPQVKVYSTPTCPYCKKEKKWLKENDIDYEDIDASDPENAKEMSDVSGQMGVPVTVIGEGDDQEVIVGFKKDKLADILGVSE